MEGQTRVRRFLAGAHADRAPFLAFTTELSASLARVSVLEMFADPRVLTEAFLESLAVFDLDALVLRPPAELIGEAVAAGGGSSHPSLDPVAEGIRRLRVLLGDRTGIVLVLPGPRTLTRSLNRGAAVEDLEDVAAGLLTVAQALEPPLIDCLALFEREPLDAAAAGDLETASALLWNAARYYSIPGLLVADRAGPEVARGGATAVAVVEGASPGELEAAGASRVGVVVDDGEDLPACPASGFYITAGELAPDAEVESIQALTARLREASERARQPDIRREG